MAGEIEKVGVFVGALIASGLGGVSSNYLLDNYKIEQNRKELDENKIEVSKLREYLKDLVQAQNVCVTNTKVLEARLNMQERSR